MQHLLSVIVKFLSAFFPSQNLFLLFLSDYYYSILKCIVIDHKKSENKKFKFDFSDRICNKQCNIYTIKGI